jgi:exodeoxyribonuclease V alpha subunit
MLEIKNDKNFSIDNSHKKEPFSLLDIYFAKNIITKNFETSNDNLINVFAYLFHISKKNHLFFEYDIEKQKFSPTLQSVFFEIDEKILSTLEKSILNGADELLKYSTIDQIKVIKKSNLARFYLKKFFLFEDFIKKQIKRLNSNKCSINELLLNKINSDTSLIDEQQKALTNALSRSISIIYGGPGTGKSFLATKLVKYLLEQKNLNIVITAFTGKAKNHLKSSILSFDQNLTIDAKTLHQLLKLKKEKDIFLEENFLTYDLVIVDEASMVDIRLMAKLLGSLKNSSKLLLLGDCNQLPPVGSIDIFTKMLTLENEISITKLSKYHRFENKNLLEVIKKAKDFISYENFSNNDLKKLANNSCEVFEKELTFIKEEITKIAKSKYCFFDIDENNIKSAFSKFINFKILAPSNDGFGILEINNHILKTLQQTAINNTKIALPIIITKNDYSLDLFNGTFGIIIASLKKSRNNSNIFYEYACFLDEKQKIRKIKTSILPSFEIAYCISVHKSQGSEFKDVLLVLPNTKTIDTKLLYTAITRAKSSIQILINKS